MQIKIGKKAYSSNPAMITLIRYYVEFRESFLAAYLSGACGALEVARLAWSSIDGPKPDFDTFLVAAAESRGFAAADLYRPPYWPLRALRAEDKLAPKIRSRRTSLIFWH